MKADFYNEKGYNLEAKGCNQGCNLDNSLTKTPNLLKNNKLAEKSIWISRKEGCNLLGISHPALFKHIKNGHFVTRRVKMNGGIGYEIELNSVLNWLTVKGEIKKKFEILRRYFPEKEAERAGIDGADLTAKQKEIALAKDALLRAYEENIEGLPHGKIKQAKLDFMEAYNTGELFPEIFAVLGERSHKTVEKWFKRWKENKRDALCLAPGYRYREVKGFPITEEERKIFLDLFLSPQGVKISKAYQITKYILEKQGKKISASEATFRRFANEIKKKNKQITTLLRRGQGALRDEILPYLERDLDKLEVGDVFVADGKTTTFDVINPFTGRPQKATLVAYMDWASYDIAGWELMITENTQAIASALRSAIIRLGRVPKIAYQDNGKAFRNKFFKGSPNFDEIGFTGLFARLGITAVYSLPYNARAKAIEGRWKEVIETFEKLLPSFTGTSPVDKPAYMMRNEKFHKKWKSALTGDFVPTLREAKEMIEAWLEFYRSQPHPRQKDKTIGEVFNAGRGLGVNIEELDDLMMNYGDKPRTVKRNGVELLGAHYYDEALTPWVGEKVLVKYSLWDLGEVVVEDLQGRKICRAKRLPKVHPMAEYLGEPKDVTEFKEQLKRQKRMEREVIKKGEEIMRARAKALNNNPLKLFLPEPEEEREESGEKIYKFLTDLEDDEEDYWEMWRKANEF